jgi:hypothetical protein
LGFWSSPTPATDRIEEAYPLVDRDAYPAQLAHRARCQAFPIWNAVRSEIGQMDMYVRIYDDLKRDEGDNPRGVRLKFSPRLTRNPAGSVFV